ncbi:MAG TPA: hypothetical protein VH186_01095 [Chloroflexia bacterium]|nr:hypothetical protein [Chloroflexia bacterium]
MLSRLHGLRRYFFFAALIVITFFSGIQLRDAYSSLGPAATSTTACIRTTPDSVTLKSGDRTLPPGNILLYSASGTCQNGDTALNLQGPQGPSGASGIYGDGSAGDLNVSGPLDLSNFINLQFASISVASGAVLTVPSGAVLRATGSVIISGTVQVATGASSTVNGDPHPGISRAAAGLTSGGFGLSNFQAAQISHPQFGGGAGKRGQNNPGIFSGEGEGGGSLTILAQGSFTLSSGGVIRANGNNGGTASSGSSAVGGGGGGAGGIVNIAAKSSITLAGGITANGGNGGDGFNATQPTVTAEGGGGGGGGVIHFYAPTIVTTGASLQAVGGAAGNTAIGNIGGSTVLGGGGGAAGGNGGNAGTGSVATAPQNGFAGYANLQTITSTPETFFL